MVPQNAYRRSPTAATNLINQFGWHTVTPPPIIWTCVELLHTIFFCIDITLGWNEFQDRRGTESRSCTLSARHGARVMTDYKKNATTYAKMHRSHQIGRKIGKSLSFPKMYNSKEINMFFIVKKCWNVTTYAKMHRSRQISRKIGKCITQRK